MPTQIHATATSPTVDFLSASVRAVAKLLRGSCMAAAVPAREEGARQELARNYAPSILLLSRRMRVLWLLAFRLSRGSRHALPNRLWEWQRCGAAWVGSTRVIRAIFTLVWNGGPLGAIVVRSRDFGMHGQLEERHRRARRDNSAAITKR